jgi:hypothetical protein
MNIAKALKTKNRIAGELARTKAIFARENSYRASEPPKSSPSLLLEKIKTLQNELIETKTKIALASAPISEKLAKMGELKAFMAWLTELPIREGIQRERYPLDKTEPEVWEAFVGHAERDQDVSNLQKQINDLQDEIDDFNAKTQV